MIQKITKVLPIVILGAGLIKGVGKTKSLFHVSRSMAVQTEVNLIARALKLEAFEGPLPETPEAFAEFVRKHISSAAGITRDPSIDMWGTPYALVASARGARVFSLGPDKQPNTDDDVVAEVGVSLGNAQ